MSVYYILVELANEPSRLAKEAILKREINNNTLKAVLTCAYDPFINYWIKKIPFYAAIPNDKPAVSMLEAAIAQLGHLSRRELTGNSAIYFLQNMLSQLHSEDALVIERIIERDLACGIETKTINKIWPGLIPTHDVMLCHKDISGIKYPAYAQNKLDGMRCYLHFDGIQATATTRNGKAIELHGALDASAKRMLGAGVTLDGELLVVNKSDIILDRKTGNGLLHKGVKGTISKEEAQQIRFVAWDIVDFSGKIAYIDRLKALYAMTADADSKIWKVKTITVNSPLEAQSFYESCIADGQEGAVLKNMHSMWEPKRTKNLGKMKAEESCDIIIVGIEEGTGKNVGKLGAFVCETSDGLLRTNVGTGFSDEEREKYFTELVIGQVVEVKYNQLITDKKTGMHSLFLPVFIEVRTDKGIANKLSELK